MRTLLTHDCTVLFAMSTVACSSVPSGLCNREWPIVLGPGKCPVREMMGEAMAKILFSNVVQLTTIHESGPLFRQCEFSTRKQSSRHGWIRVLREG